MFKFLKIGSVWALYDEDDIILTAAFCFKRRGLSVDILADDQMILAYTVQGGNVQGNNKEL